MTRERLRNAATNLLIVGMALLGGVLLFGGLSGRDIGAHDEGFVYVFFILVGCVGLTALAAICWVLSFVAPRDQPHGQGR